MLKAAEVNLASSTERVSGELIISPSSVFGLYLNFSKSKGISQIVLKYCKIFHTL